MAIEEFQSASKRGGGESGKAKRGISSPSKTVGFGESGEPSPDQGRDVEPIR
jgi:hypothetical protein